MAFGARQGDVGSSCQFRPELGRYTLLPTGGVGGRTD